MYRMGGGICSGDAKISNIYGVLEIPDVHSKNIRNFKHPKKYLKF